MIGRWLYNGTHHLARRDARTVGEIAQRIARDLWPDGWSEQVEDGVEYYVFKGEFTVAPTPDPASGVAYISLSESLVQTVELPG